MSVHAIIGMPGAGKSYEAVQRAYDAVESGRAVITNLPLNLKHEFWIKALEDNLLFMVKSTSKALPNETDHFGHIEAWLPIMDTEKKQFHRTAKKVKKGEAGIMGPLVIVDEASITLGEMIRNKRKDPSFDKLMDFFKTHRHSHIDMLMMYHDHGQMDMAIKQTTERYHHIKNMSEIMGADTYRVGISLKGFGGKSTFISERNGKFKKKIFELYDSYAEGDGAGTEGKKTEAGLSRSKPIWRRWWFIALMLLAFVFLPWAIYKSVTRVGSMIGSDNKTDLAPAGAGQKVVAGDLPEAGQLVQMPLAPVQPPNPIARELGWPDPSVAFIGFDNENIYFGGGDRLNLQADIAPSGFRVVEIILCRVVLVREIEVEEKNSTELLEYRCAKGQ